MKWPLASDTWDDRELEAINKVIASGRFTMGPFVQKFEREFSEFFQCEDAVMVNSGSSANLLMLTLLKEKYKLSGDIIVPAVSWSTTFFPVHQNRFKLNFVDVDINTLNIDTSKIEKAITKDTCAIFAVNLLGNPCSFAHLIDIANKYDLVLIEDNCESLGAFSAETKKFTGTIGKLGSFSFFFSHHLQTMEGGMIVCHDREDAEYLRSLRAHGWIRDLPENNSLFPKTGNSFKDSFTFVTPGYCVRPLEMSGAVGSVQLSKWPDMRRKRIENAMYFKKEFSKVRGVRIQEEIGSSTWFGFSLILEGHLENKREIVVRKFEEFGIDCRPIVAGNFMKNPVVKYLNYIDNADYPAADYIHTNGLFLGNDVTDLRQNIDLVKGIIEGIK